MYIPRGKKTSFHFMHVAYVISSFFSIYGSRATSCVAFCYTFTKERETPPVIPLRFVTKMYAYTFIFFEYLFRISAKTLVRNSCRPNEMGLE